ncbi:MAG: GatB/YqeY domain-containing protein [Longimicrobiaceae bacterium]
MAGSALKEQIRGDLNTARRERDKLRTTVLTTLLSDLRNREIEVGHELTDEEVLPVVGTGIKRRREAAEQMRGGGREELAAKEDEEAKILAVYLPPQLGEAEVRAFVREAVSGGAKDLGGVMKAVMPRVKGQFDGKELNRIVREELG